MKDSYSELDFLTRAEVFTRARDLAFSILPIDEVATEIALEAMHGAQLCRNKKKHHKENYKYKKYGPTRVLLEENQLVQAYVYRESEKYEKYSEGDSNQKINPSLADLIKHAPLSEENLVVRYLKFLIQISHDNSVNAVLVMTKLIYSYSTRDAAEIYMHLHSDAPEENYFSKRKWEFMKRLEERFHTLIERGVLTVCIGKKRERYFRGQESPDSCWTDLAKEYLKLFTPWGTSCLLAGAEGSLMEKFFERLEKIFSKDKRELNCIHTTLCPDCCTKLMKDLSLPDPSELLTLPRFNLEKKGGKQMNGGGKRQHPRPKNAEVETALRFLDHEAARRKRAALAGIKKISVSIDTEEEKDLDLSETDIAQFIVDETVKGGSRLIKFYSEDEEGALLLATVLLNRSDIQPSLARRLLGRKRYLLLEGKQKVEFAIAFFEDYAGCGKFTVDVRCQTCPGDESLSSLSFWPPIKLSHQQSALAAVVVALALAVTWLIIKNRELHIQLENSRIELNSEQETVRWREQELRRQIGDQRTREDQLEKLLIQRGRKDLANQGQEIAQLKQPQQSITAVILEPDLETDRESSTGVGRSKKLTIPANTRRIQLQLNFKSKEKYESYRTALTFERESGQIWDKNMLHAKPYRNGKAIVLDIPSNVFTGGDYRITLTGVSAGVEAEEIDSYSFTVVKK
jgi:hypothetical protein